MPEGIPDTWEEYREVAKSLTNKEEGMYGISVSATTGQLGGTFDYVLWSMGGAWADEDWNVTIDSDATREALKHLKEIQDYADPSVSYTHLDVYKRQELYLSGRINLYEQHLESTVVLCYSLLVSRKRLC